MLRPPLGVIICGITAAYRRDGVPVSTIIYDLFSRQRSRGLDGFGLVTMGDDNKVIARKYTHEPQAVSDLFRLESELIIFHHRIPTSTQNVHNASHPFVYQSGKGRRYYTVHNGIIHNDDEVKKGHDELGIVYTSLQENGQYNDSEALAIELGRYFAGEQEKIESAGSIAFVTLEVNKVGRPIALHFGRNYSNPLHITLDDEAGSICLSSITGKEEVKAHELNTFDLKTGVLTKKDLMLTPHWTRSPKAQAGFWTGSRNTGLVPVSTIVTPLKKAITKSPAANRIYKLNPEADLYNIPHMRIETLHNKEIDYTRAFQALEHDDPNSPYLVTYLEMVEAIEEELDIRKRITPLDENEIGYMFNPRNLEQETI